MKVKEKLVARLSIGDKGRRYVRAFYWLVADAMSQARWRLALVSVGKIANVACLLGGFGVILWYINQATESRSTAAIAVDLAGGLVIPLSFGAVLVLGGSLIIIGATLDYLASYILLRFLPEYEQRLSRHARAMVDEGAIDGCYGGKSRRKDVENRLTGVDCRHCCLALRQIFMSVSHPFGVVIWGVGMVVIDPELTLVVAVVGGLLTPVLLYTGVRASRAARGLEELAPIARGGRKATREDGMEDARITAARKSVLGKGAFVAAESSEPATAGALMKCIFYERYLMVELARYVGFIGLGLAVVLVLQEGTDDLGGAAQGWTELLAFILLARLALMSAVQTAQSFAALSRFFPAVERFFTARGRSTVR